jgi:hypothetical protein
LAVIGSTLEAFQHIAGPISSAITNWYGCRLTAIFGGVIAAIGLIASAFSSNFYVLVFFIGCVSGFGSSLVMVSSIVVVTYYFEKRPSFATGIVVSSASFSSAFFTMIIIKLNEAYGRSGCFIILGGFLFNIVVCGALFRTHHLETKVRKKNSNNNKEANPLDEILDTSINCNATTTDTSLTNSDSNSNNFRIKSGDSINNNQACNIPNSKQSNQITLSLLHLPASKKQDYRTKSHSLKYTPEESGKFIIKNNNNKQSNSKSTAGYLDSVFNDSSLHAPLYFKNVSYFTSLINVKQNEDSFADLNSFSSPDNSILAVLDDKNSTKDTKTTLLNQNLNKLQNQTDMDDEDDLNYCLCLNSDSKIIKLMQTKPLLKPLWYIYINFIDTLTLFNRFGFCVFAISNMLISFFYETPYFFINSYMTENGISVDEAGVVTISLGVVGIFSTSSLIFYFSC